MSETKLRRAWLSFMQSQYYNLSSFKKENACLGTTRAITLEILERMMWGDMICCFYEKSGIMPPLWYATWPITKVVGLNKNAIRHIADNCQTSIVDLGGLLTICAYGSYTTGLTYRVEAPLDRIARLLQGFQATGGDIGNPRIACGPGVLKHVKMPYPIFPNIPFDLEEIRPFNLSAARADINHAGNKKRLVAKGFYLLEKMNDPEHSWPLNPSPEMPAKNYLEDMEGGVGCGLVQSALNYIPAEDRTEHITL